MKNVWNCDQDTLIASIDADSRYPLEMIAMGQCGYILKYNHRKISIDVVYSDLFYKGTTCSRRLIPPPFPKEKAPAMDLYLVSHDHADHNDKEFFRWKMQDSTQRMIAPDCVLQQYHRSYQPIAGIIPVPVAHETYAYDENGCSKNYGFIIQTPAGALFHCGDALVTPELHETLQNAGLHFRFMMLDINGRWREGIIGNMNADEAIAFAKSFHVDYLIPTHWDMFKENGADIGDFCRKAKVAGIHYLIQHPGQKWCFD